MNVYFILNEKWVSDGFQKLEKIKGEITIVYVTVFATMI